MSMRDTQFKAFAELLFGDFPWRFDLYIESSDDGWEERWKQRIARRAYDLVSHTLLNVSMSDLDMLSHEECVQRIPDMTAWPEVPKW